MIIKAKFTGSNSLGYERGKEYRLEFKLETPVVQDRVKIREITSIPTDKKWVHTYRPGSECIYGSLDAFLDNWDSITKRRFNLKYLQDMTHEDFIKVFGNSWTISYMAAKIASFKSLHGFMSTIGDIGNFKSYATAQELGYDVEFSMPIKTNDH
jgi:hypothetical protein